MTIQDRFIPREEIAKLLWGMLGDISTHSSDLQPTQSAILGFNWIWHNGCN